MARAPASRRSHQPVARLRRFATTPSPSPRGLAQLAPSSYDAREAQVVDALVEQPSSTVAPRRPRLVDERSALVLEHVEDHVHEFSAVALEQLAARPALVVERADDPVEHALARAQRARHLREQRTRSARPAPRPRRAETALRALDGRERTRARPRDLERPFRPARDAAWPRAARIGRYARAGPSAPIFEARTISQFFSLPSSFEGTSAHSPSSRSPCRITVSVPFGRSCTSS